MTTLTPSQFRASRALAAAHHHLWSGVPSGTYNIDDIRAWSKAHQHPSLPPGIFAPFIDEGWVIHTTGSGRLRWRVNEIGNVILDVFRPQDLSPVGAAMARTFGYAAIQSVQPPEEEGILVASLTVLNGPEWGDLESFSFGKLEIGSTSYAKTHDESGQLISGWNLFSEKELHDDMLFHRHVYALVRPLVALLTANDEVPERESKEERDARLAPAIAQARALLAPLFEIALPDPVRVPELGYEDESIIYPETYWTRRCATEVVDDGRRSYGSSFMLYEVVHHDECIAVETERVATWLTLALRKDPDRDILEAIDAANRSRQYRPAHNDN